MAHLSNVANRSVGIEALVVTARRGCAMVMGQVGANHPIHQPNRRGHRQLKIRNEGISGLQEKKTGGVDPPVGLKYLVGPRVKYII